MSDQVVSAENAEEKILLENLPTDVLLMIFLYCDEVSLGRLSQQCRRFNEIINEDCIWAERSRKAIVTNQLSKEMQERSFCILPLREKCRISSNWRKGRFKENIYFSHKTRYMPWLVMNHDHLWLSKGNTILCYQRKSDGLRSNCAVQRLTGHQEDVCRFVEAEDMIFSGGRDGAICGWCSDSGEFILSQRDSHTSDINSVTYVKDVLVSGSRDKTIKFWRWQWSDRRCELLRTIDVQDRVWSTSASPHGGLCAIGSSGYHQIPPLHIYDIEHGLEIMKFNEAYVSGAGILDTLWESPHHLFSTGYDGYIRLWDTRTGWCVNTWEDPYDSPIYCLASDNVHTILCGTSHHGRVQLWDKRQQHSLQQRNKTLIH
ncbi:F-box/WD repeat-containing protein 7, partial [Gryllus bimaculatus]